MRPFARLMLLAAALALCACTTLRAVEAPIEHWLHLPPAAYGDD